MLLICLLIGTCYSYLVYPITLAAFVYARRAGAESRAECVSADTFEPKVSLIITAYNEEQRIRQKLHNALDIEYPELEIIVASDCSTDATDEIVKTFFVRGVKLERVHERRGKEYAQQKAIGSSNGTILVFSDVGTRMDRDAVRRIVAYFKDGRIGAVSSEDRFIRDDGTLVGEGAYVRYEMYLRRLESRFAGLVGLSGSFFAARRQVCEAWDVETPSDFNTAMCCARFGLKAVTAPDVVGYYPDLRDSRKEYQRKVRTVLRGITGLFRHLDLLSPRRYGWFAWQVFSHKLMRWFVPPFLIALFVVSAAQFPVSPLARLLLVMQLACYLLALLTHWFKGLHRLALPRLILFFCLANIAIAHAGLQYIVGKRITAWQPSVR